MNDTLYASMFFAIFAVALVVYGLVLARTGNKELLPYNAQHSVRNSEDVKRVGRIVAVIGFVIGALSLLFMGISQMS